MKYWIITDTHFNHAKIIEYGRPANFEQQIKDNLKRFVKPEDVLIHLGDICIGNDKENSNWFKKHLNCKTILVLGNHDNKSNSWYLKNGWDWVCKRMHLKMFGKRMAFSHEPIPWDNYYDINLHGHLHECQRYEGEFELTERNVLLSLEDRNYRPVNLESIINPK